MLALPAAAAPPPRVRSEVFLRSPQQGVAVMAYAFYTRPRGGAMISLEQRWTRSDTIDVAFERRSTDYGRTWSAPVEMRTGEKRPEGTWRRHPRAGYADPRSGRYLELWIEGVLPSDDPLEGLRQWRIFYRAGNGPPRQVVHAGREYSEAHPLPGVWIGKNCAMLGDMTSVPVTAPDGAILLPVQLTPLDAQGNLYNPTGGYTYTEAALLRGRWRGDALEWEMSEVIQGDPARSTRGMVEPTIEFLADGRLLMVLRGSNDRKPELPAYRWVSFSADGGRRWTKPEPWTYHDGQPFFSPSSCSQLVRHSSGRLFWIGNLTRENPRGNRPRYPLVIAEVDRGSGLLLRQSVTVIDTLRQGEDPVLTLSNFFAREDRRTREIAIHVTRLFALSSGWRGDAWLHRVAVT
jgi:hypothetical protein